MTMGKGIAIAGMWLAVALSGLFVGMGAILIAFFAMIATCAIGDE